MDELFITIDGEKQEIEKYDVQENSMVYITTEQGVECIIVEDREVAGVAAREYWADMVEHDPEEFRCMVGDEVLVKWAMGQPAGPGEEQVESLEEWLDLWFDIPEEHFASFDGTEHEAELDVAAQLEFEMPESVVLYYV